MQNWFWSPVIGMRGLVLRNAVDAGGPGGPSSGDASVDAGQDAGGDGGDSNTPPETTDAGQAPDVRASGDDEDPDADDFDESEFDDLKRQDPRVAKLLKSRRKLASRDRRATPIVQGLKALGIDPKDPVAVAAFLKNGATPRPPANAPAHAHAPQPQTRTEPDPPKWTPLKADAQFDETPFRDWDLTNPANKTLYDGFKKTHEHEQRQNLVVNAVMAMSEENQKLAARLDAIEKGGLARERQAEGQQWRTEVQTAAQSIKDPEVRGLFLDAIYGAATRERQAGRKADPKAIVAKALDRFKRAGSVTAGEAAKVTAAAQGIADRNRTLPSRSAMAPGGPPASPAADRSRETLKSIHKRLVPGYIGARG